MAAGKAWDRLLIRLLFRLGRRVSEAVDLTLENINLQQGTVTIQHLKSRVNLSCPKFSAHLGRSHSFCPKCDERVNQALARDQQCRRVRSLPVDGETLAMLREYIGRGRPVQKGGKDMLFGIGRGQAWRVVNECARRAGLPPLVNPEQAGCGA